MMRRSNFSSSSSGWTEKQEPTPYASTGGASPLATQQRYTFKGRGEGNVWLTTKRELRRKAANQHFWTMLVSLVSSLSYLVGAEDSERASRSTQLFRLQNIRAAGSKLGGYMSGKNGRSVVGVTVGKVNDWPDVVPAAAGLR